jgi:hypothetical protein
MSNRPSQLQDLKPMQAVVALYAKGDPKLSAAIFGKLSEAIFGGCKVCPASRIKSTLSRISHRVLRWTTRTTQGQDHTGADTTFFKNRILERSGHAYAAALLTSSHGGVVGLVEGGDPMNGPYMLIVPEIKKNCGLWDKLFLDSVQGRDVQCRLIWETRATYQMAKQILSTGKTVRMKAIAAGTGLSLTLVYDRLIRDGFSPDQVTAHITDRDAESMGKANCVLDTLVAAQEPQAGREWRRGISAKVEDLFCDATPPAKYDIVTAIGILEYFQGHAYTTTEHRLKLELAEDTTTAHHLIERLTAMTVDGGHLIINTYRNDPSTRILELFGKRFDYRHEENLRALLAAQSFLPVLLVGSGNIYDVKVYIKDPAVKV